MKKIYLHLLTVCLVLNCIGTASAVNWVKKESSFPGDARKNAASFVIGSKAYVGTGYLYKNYQNVYFDDFWQYDSETETWTEIADFPGEVRDNTISFSVNGKGYVGLGSSSSVYYKDFYEYNPANDTWTKIADFPDARTGAVVFVINDVAYVGTGYDRDLDDLKSNFYKYESGKWTAVASLPTDEARDNATAYTLNGKGYVVSGGYGPGVFGGTDSIWEYDPVSNTWEKTGYFGFASNLLRSYVSDNTPFVLLRNELYKYDSENDFFSKTGNVFNEIEGITGQALFVINDVPYMTLGTDNDFMGPVPNLDLWYDADADSSSDCGKLIDSGTFGNNNAFSWFLCENGTLSIGGIGEMPDVYDEINFVRTAPWANRYSWIKTVIIEQGITSIGDYAFYGYQSLRNVTIPSSVKSIGFSAFSFCNLSEISIPEGVSTIENYAFSNCTSLSEITIPETVTSIGDYAFDTCPLMKITVKKSIPIKINENVFFQVDKANCKLIVPVGSKAAYATWETGGVWTYFKIVEEGTERDNIATVTKKSPMAYYNIIGQKLSQEPENGLYIILYNDGTSEKVIKR